MQPKIRPRTLELKKAEAERSKNIRGGSVSKVLIFGPPPLVAGEDSAAYDQLLERVSGTVKPRDIFE